MDTRILNGKIYDDGPFGGTQIGRICSGKIYEGTWMGGNEIGRIQENGEIIIQGSVVGKINDGNEIFEGTWMGGNAVGKITDSGEIRCGFWMGGNYAGRIVFDEIAHSVKCENIAYKMGGASNNQYTSNNNSEKLDLSWMDADQHKSNLVGLISCVANGLVLAVIGMGAGRIIISSLIVFCLVAGTLNTKKAVEKKKYNDKILAEEKVFGVIAAIIIIPIYLLIVLSYF